MEKSINRVLEIPTPAVVVLRWDWPVTSAVPIATAVILRPYILISVNITLHAQ